MPGRDTARTWVALLASLAVLAAAGAGALRVRFDDDPLAALPAGDPELRAFREAAEPFGTLRTLLVGVERDDLFSKESLDQLRAFSNRAASIPGVAEVVSFTELPLVRAGISSLETAELVERPVPADPRSLDEIRKRVLANPLVAGRLVATDGAAALVPVLLDPARAAPRDAARAVADLARRTFEGGRVVIGGAPGAALAVSEAQAGAGPLLALVLLAALGIGLGLLLRCWYAVLLALLAAAVSAGVALSGPALLGWRLAPSALVVLLGVAGLALLVSAHVLLARDRAAARARGSGPLAQGAVACAVAGGVMLAVAGDAQSALLLLGGALAVLVCAALVLPALARPRADAAAPGESSAWRSRRPLLATVLTVACAAPFLGVPKARVAVDPGEAFPAGAAPRAAQEFLDGHFGGTDILFVALRGPAATLEALDALRSIEAAALADPRVREVLSLMGAIRVAFHGKPTEFPATDKDAGAFMVLGDRQPGMVQLLRRDRTGLCVAVKVRPGTPPEHLLRLREALQDAVPGVLRFARFADADPALRGRMEAELLDRLGFRLAPTGIDASRRAPAMLRLLLDEMEKGSGLDADALAARLGEHFVDGTTNVLVTDLETGAPFAVGAEQRRAMAEHIVAAGRIDAQTVRGALVAAFPPAAGDEQGLELEASQVLQSIDRPDTAAAAGKDPLPPFVRGWAQVEASSPDAAYAAGEEMLAAAAELRHGGVALPAGDGVLLDVRAGGMPLASASVRGATVRSLATGFLFAAGFLLVLWTCVLLLGSGTAYDPRDPRCAVRATGSRQGWRELSRCLSDAVPLALVPLAACSFALGGAAFLRLPFDPGATATLAVALTLGGAIGVLLVLPWTRFAAVPPESRAAARRVALHLGPALAAACLALSLIPLPPARTMGLVLAASILAAAGLGAAHAGRGSPG